MTFIKFRTEWFRKFRSHHPVFFGMMVSVLAILVFFISFYLYIAYLLPLPAPIHDFVGSRTTKIYDRSGQLLYEVLLPESGQKSTLPLSNIPMQFVQATLASEDSNYYSHPGVDVFAIGRAVLFNTLEQRIVSGASTITQQLVRNMMGTKPSRNLSDKIMEAFYAIRINNVYSKDQILELYLNTIYYGNLSYGAQAASLNYFGKNLSDLDLAQSTFIAGLPQSPTNYNPYTAFEKAKKRQRYVLNQMAESRFIDRSTADIAYAEPINLKSKKLSMKAPHFVQYVLNELESLYGEDTVLHGGLTVTTTLDYGLQQTAEELLQKQVTSLERNHVTDGALVAVDVHTGQILSWVGSADYFDEKISGAIDMVTALRQPGSSIKPLNYLAAFERGHTPGTVINDIPTQFNTDTGPYSPKNYDLDYHGPVRVRTALASSYNIPAVKTLDYVGVENFIAFLKILGIDTLDHSPSFYGLALTLGGAEVRLLDMAQAFLVIANYGTKIPQSTLLKVRDQSGKTLLEWQQPVGDFVLGSHGKEHAYQIIDILKDPNARIPGFGEDSVLEISRPAAVKTGTTRNFRDNLTVGFTPDLLTAVWIGNADATPMENISGVDGAAPLWANFMQAALAGRPKTDFLKPENLVQVEICALSGMLPTDLCRDRVLEWFVPGTEPKEPDNFYRKYLVDLRNDHIVPPECVNGTNSSYIKEKTLVAYPGELQKWAGQKGLQLPPINSCSTSSGYPNASSQEYPGGHVISVSIDNPAKNDEYLLDTSLPLRDQKVPFRVTAPVTTVKVMYVVDGQPVATVTSSPFTFLWLPTKGAHTLEASVELQNGDHLESGKTFFTVR